MLCSLLIYLRFVFLNFLFQSFAIKALKSNSFANVLQIKMFSVSGVLIYPFLLLLRGLPFIFRDLPTLLLQSANW